MPSVHNTGYPLSYICGQESKEQRGKRVLETEVLVNHCCHFTTKMLRTLNKSFNLPQSLFFFCKMEFIIFSYFTFLVLTQDKKVHKTATEI